MAASVPALDAGAEQIAEHALARGGSGSLAPVGNSGGAKKPQFAKLCPSDLPRAKWNQIHPVWFSRSSNAAEAARKCSTDAHDRPAVYPSDPTSRTRPLRGLGEPSDVELPTSLRMDGFTFRKREPPASHGNGVRLAADQVHLDRGPTLVPSGLVGERRDRKIAFEFTIDAAEKVEIELRGDASSVIIRGDQSPDVFAQVDSDNRLATLTDMLAHTAKQGGGFGAPEIAECGARKKGGAGMSGNVAGNVEILREIGDDRPCRKFSKATPNALRRLREKIRRNVDRRIHPRRLKRFDEDFGLDPRSGPVLKQHDIFTAESRHLSGDGAGELPSRSASSSIRRGR